MCPKNNVAELYPIMDRSDLRSSFDSTFGDTSNMYRFLNRKDTITM